GRDYRGLERVPLSAPKAQAAHRTGAACHLRDGSGPPAAASGSRSRTGNVIGCRPATAVQHLRLAIYGPFPQHHSRRGRRSGFERRAAQGARIPELTIVRAAAEHEARMPASLSAAKTIAKIGRSAKKRRVWFYNFQFWQLPILAIYCASRVTP